jgi:hypothetical protein
LSIFAKKSIFHFYFQSSPQVFFIFNFKSFYYLQFSPQLLFFAEKPSSPKNQSRPNQLRSRTHVTIPVGLKYTWQVINSAQCQNWPQNQRHITNTNPVSLSAKSRSNTKIPEKTSRTFIPNRNPNYLNSSQARTNFITKNSIQQ